MPLGARLCLAATALALVACSDLAAYATGPGEVYRGTVVGAEETGIVRVGFPSNTRLDMTFDPELAADLDTPPGVLTTSDGTLASEPLLTIPQLSHDVLADYEIPSGERLRNYIFVMRPSAGPLAGRDPSVFVSLMGDGTIEVRVIAGGGRSPDRYYGFFRLTRQPQG